MNRNDFLNMIEDNIPINRQMIGEVYELIDIFPYFQSAHMLLLKGLQNNEDIKFEKQLRNSAIHIADREVLYYFLRTKISPVSEKRNDKPAIDSKAEIVSDSQQTVIESAKNSDQMISNIEKHSDEAKIKDNTDLSSLAQGHSIMIASEPDMIEPAEVIFFTEEETYPDEEKVFFMDPGFLLPERSDLLELDLDVHETNALGDEEIIHEQHDQVQKTSEKQIQSELIDKFIIANPRIETSKEKSSIPADDISKPFVEESGGLVTETLARIYVSQGYYSKAIDIYEKLSLKFPEKSSYFASQIEKVKEHIKK
jgi:hypothetical protein